MSEQDKRCKSKATFPSNITGQVVQTLPLGHSDPLLGLELSALGPSQSRKEQFGTCAVDLSLYLVESPRKFSGM